MGSQKHIFANYKESKWVTEEAIRLCNKQRWFFFNFFAFLRHWRHAISWNLCPFRSWHFETVCYTYSRKVWPCSASMRDYASLTKGRNQLYSLADNITKLKWLREIKMPVGHMLGAWYWMAPCPVTVVPNKWNKKMYSDELATCSYLGNHVKRKTTRGHYKKTVPFQDMRDPPTVSLKSMDQQDAAGSIVVTISCNL